MTRLLMTLSAVALLTACSGSTDDAETANEGEVTVATQTVNTCPDDMVFDLTAYGEETLPETDDFEAWHIENATRDGINTTDSGLQYKVNQAGLEDGLKPLPGEEIFAHYHGYFPNGQVFDSSYLRGSPLIGPSNAFIRGWNEALAEMKVCEARTLYIPADLAYGNNGAGGRPTGTLVFNMQLLRVNRN